MALDKYKQLNKKLYIQEQPERLSKDTKH